MVIKHRLEIVQVSKNDHNGHITVHARVIEQNGDHTELGAIETHGIELLALERLHNGDAQEWLRHVSRKMLDAHTRRCRHHVDLKGLEGKIIDIEPLV